MKHYLIPGLFLFGTLFFAVLYVVGPTEKNEILEVKQPQSGTVPYGRLQNLKQQTAVRVDLKREQALLNKKDHKPILDPEANKKNSFHKLNINNELGPAARDLNTRNSVDAVTIDQKMDEFLAKKQKFEELEKAERQASIDRFIEEAAAMGYDIKVNQDMEVVSVKKKSYNQ